MSHSANNPSGAVINAAPHKRSEKAMASRQGASKSKKDEDANNARVVARYLADMSGQLESMARASKLELLAYLLAMARAEAENVAMESGPTPNGDE